MESSKNALLLCLAVLAAASCNTPKSTSEHGETGAVVLRLAESMPEEYPSAQAAERLAALVKERSGGRISIRVYYGGKLGTPRQVIDQIQFGGIAMARVNSFELSEVVVPLQKTLDPRSYADGDALMKNIAAGAESIADECLRERIVPMVFYYPDIRCFYSDDAQFRSIADFAGLRIGVAESAVLKRAVGGLGAVPVPHVSADTYKSLRTGFIQARETTFSEFALSGDYPFVRHLAMTRYISGPDVIIMSPELLNGISTAERRMIEDCAKETYGYQKDLLDKFHVQWISRMRDDRKDVFWEDGKFIADIRSALR